MASDTLKRHGRGATRFGMLALGVSALLAGCGGSSKTSNGPASKFLGLWERDSTNTTFAATCPVSGSMGTTPIWFELNLEHGVLTDATDTSGSCLAPGVSFDVDSGGTKLSAPNPNPYTGKATECIWFVTNDSAGNPVFMDITFSSLTFTLLAQVKDKAPTGMLAGTGTADVLQVDVNGQFVITDTCTIASVGDTFHRMTQP